MMWSVTYFLDPSSQGKTQNLIEGMIQEHPVTTRLKTLKYIMYFEGFRNQLP